MMAGLLSGSTKNVLPQQNRNLPNPNFTPQAGGGRLLGRPRQAVLEEPPQGPDLLAAPVVEEELRPLDLLPPAGQGHPLQSPAQLRRAQDPQGGVPPRRVAIPEDRPRPRRQG